jgi:hypothetical protein
MDAIPFRATLFEKTLAANWLVVWHQDTALPLRERQELQGWGPWSIKEGINYAHAPSTILSQVLALRIHFDDSTSVNGPLRVLPGTHEMGVLSGDQIHDLSKRVMPVDCVVPKGGVVAMRPLVVHASSKSQVEKPRRVLHIEYAASNSIAAPCVWRLLKSGQFLIRANEVSWAPGAFAHWPAPRRACADVLDCRAACGRAARDPDSAK